MKKIYIAGCGGMLGEAFYRQFRENYMLKCTDIDLNETWLSFLDFRDLEAYEKDVSLFQPDILIHLGAYTDLEYCEENEADTYMTNTISVENAVYIANRLGIPVVYISTAGIFDGKKDVYDDWDVPNPLGVYARSKYMGERYVVENANCYLICRAGWMMGAGPKKDKKFIQKIMKQLKDGAKQLYIVNDKDGTPTYTHDFAVTVRNLLENELWGLYNCVCTGVTSRFEVAQELIRLVGKEKDVKLIPVSSDHFRDVYFAERPPSERLLNKKLELRGMNSMRDWRVALKIYLEEYYQEYL